MCIRDRSLFETLTSFENLTDLQDFAINVVVIDNDETDQLRSEVEKFSEQFKFPLGYVHAPAKNISIARNAALDAAQGRWLALIDDDETAEPQWLTKLMENKEGYEVVIGQCEAIYSEDMPAWLMRCDFHSNRLTGRTENAYTSNALLDMDFIKSHDLRFRPELGKTGGEDTIFFRELSNLGGKIKYCPDSRVLEPVPPGRANMEWVKTRKFRSGQTHGLLCKDFDPQAYRMLFLSAGMKLLVCTVMTLLTIPGTYKSRGWWARAYLHAGALSYRLKPTILKEYA